MIICRINENREWILVQNLGGEKLKEIRATAPKTPMYDGYWNGEGWVPQSQKAAALVFPQYELAKTYLHDNRAAMELTVEAP